MPSCSQLLELNGEPEIVVETADRPVTKSIDLESFTKEEILHLIQSNHITMLVGGVVFQDSIYVQTLTDKDMLELHISESEIEFSKSYVDVLNSAKHLVQTK